MLRFDPHTHSDTSNTRLLDSICRVEDLIDKAVKIGLAGIALTDHECLSNLPAASFYGEKIREEHPDFKVAL